MYLYGALVAAREAKLAHAAPWLVPHAYASWLNEMMEQFAVLEREARTTLAVLGVDPPPFAEDDDRFAEAVPKAKLGDALAPWDRYAKCNVLERIRASKSAAFVPQVTAFLEDRLRFSRYEPQSVMLYEELHAVAYLKKHEARAELARVRGLPDLGDWARELIDDTEA